MCFESSFVITRFSSHVTIYGNEAYPREKRHEGCYSVKFQIEVLSLETAITIVPTAIRVLGKLPYFIVVITYLLLGKPAKLRSHIHVVRVRRRSLWR